MKQSKGNIVVEIALAVAIVATMISMISANKAPQASQPLGSAQYTVRFNAVSTSSVMSIGTGSSSRLIGTSTARTWLHLSNDSAFSVYLSLDSDKPAVADKGILLAASSSMDFFSDNLYFGSIQAIATGGTAKVLLTESQQP